MSLSIAGIGTAVPGEPVSQSLAAEKAHDYNAADRRQSRLVGTIYRRSGVDTRHSVLSAPEEMASGRSFFAPRRGNADRGPSTAERMARYEAEATPLAATAAARALAQAGLEAAEISHLVTVSCSGFSAPGFDVALIGALGLDAGIARTHVGFMGCHGALNGLRVARSFLESQPEARILLCAVELCSLHLFYGWDPEKIVANALFADGAAAIVGVPDHVLGNGAWRVAADGSTVVAGSAGAMTWKVRDHGFEMTLSPEVPDLIRAHVKPWLEGWLGRQGLSLGEVGSWAVHPGGPRILDAFGQGVGLEREALAASYEVLARYGNMSSPTVLFLLDHLRERSAQRPVVAMGFGPGLTVEAALIR